MKWQSDADTIDMIQSETDPIYQPTDVLFDKETDSFIICDTGQHRIVRWTSQTTETIIDNSSCYT